MECDRLLTYPQAERARESGCPGCSGTDIDLANPELSILSPNQRLAREGRPRCGDCGEYHEAGEVCRYAEAVRS